MDDRFASLQSPRVSRCGVEWFSDETLLTAKLQDSHLLTLVHSGEASGLRFRDGRNPQAFHPDIFLAQASDYRAQTHRIHRTRTAPSHVVLPVLPCDAITLDRR